MNNKYIVLPNGFITQAEFARRAGISRERVRQCIKKNKIQVTGNHEGRKMIRASEVERYKGQRGRLIEKWLREGYVCPYEFCKKFNLTYLELRKLVRHGLARYKLDWARFVIHKDDAEQLTTKKITQYKKIVEAKEKRGRTSKATRG